MPSRIVELSGPESAETFKALASEARIRILALLAEGERSIGELAQALDMVQPSVTKHIQQLEAVGLVTSGYAPGAQGTRKVCRLAKDRLIVSFEAERPPALRVEERAMPVGLYSRCEPTAPCGLAGPERMIGLMDAPQAFLLPERAQAQLLWMADGFIEYVFPNTLPRSVQLHRVEVSAEICSECPHFDNGWPSDITLWLNGVEVGTWLSPGDLGETRGRLNPAWWSDHATQHGALKVWSVDASGSYVDGLLLAPRQIADYGIAPGQPLTVRLGIKPDAEHKGGFNLFGRGFGNYEQDVLLRLHYTARTPTP